MNDVSKNIRSYIFGVLDGNITFNSSNVPCFTKAPPTQDFPYIIIKTGPFTDDHTKDKSGGVYQLEIEVNTRFEKNVGGQDDVDDITNEVTKIVSPLGLHTSNFGNNSMFILTGPQMRPIEDDDDEFHYYSKLLTYEAHVLGDATDASAITAFSYSNNGQGPIESASFVTMVPTVTPSTGTFNYYVSANDTLPSGLSLNEDTGDITMTGTIANGSYSFNIVVVGSGLASGVAEVLVTLQVQSLNPILSNPTGTSTGDTTADGTVDTDTGTGTVYAVATQSATKPTRLQIEAGQDHTGASADGSASASVSATGTQTLNFTGLPSSTTLYIHFSQTDGQGDYSNIVSSTGFTSGPFVPSDLDNLLAWFPSENQPRTSWTTAGFQLNNSGTGPDAQLLTGGAIEFVSSNSDYVAIGNTVTLTGDFEIQFWADNDGTNEIITGNGSAQTIRFISTTVIRFTINSTIYIFTTANNSNWNHYKFVRSGTDLSLYFNGTLNETKSLVVTTSYSIANICRASSSYSDIKIKDLVFYNSNPNVDHYNNPNDFVNLARTNGAVLAYSFDQGIYEDGNPVIDLSTAGNHGTFLTSAAGSYDAALNNVPVGFQTGTHGFSLPYYFDGVNDQVITSVYTMGVGEYVEFQSYISDTYQSIFTEAGGGTYDFIQLRRLSDSDMVRFRVNGNIYVHSQDCQLGINKIRLTRTSSSEYSFTLNDGTPEVFSESGAITLSVFNRLSSGTYVQSISPYLDINGTVYSNSNGFSGATVLGSPTTRRILSTSDTGTTDLFGNTTQRTWGNGKFNGWGGLHGGTAPLNLGNSQTLAFAIKVADASTNQTIFESGTPADITISSSNITCAAFSTIEVDGAASQTITDNTWHYVELQNGSVVDLDALEISAGFDGEIIPFVVTSDQITAGESTNLQTYMEGLE